MSITLVYGNSTVTLPNPRGKQRVKPVDHQAVGLTAGGTRYVYDKGVTLHHLTLTIESCSQAEYDALYYFYDTTVTGSQSQFTYTDSRGIVYLARFIAEPEIVKVHYNVFDIKLTLELNKRPE